MPIRSADATWEGSLTAGKGTMRFASGAYQGQYSFSSRFENGKGTNPEELIGAAQAGCFSMALSADLGNAGYEPQSINTTAEVHINKSGEGWSIQRIDLRCEAEVPNISDDTFEEIAEATKKSCPVSNALTGVEIALDAKLAG